MSDAEKVQILRKALEDICTGWVGHGCNDHSCCIEKPRGQGTNSRCRCRERDPVEVERALRLAVRCAREALDLVNRGEAEKLRPKIGANIVREFILSWGMVPADQIRDDFCDELGALIDTHVSQVLREHDDAIEQLRTALAFGYNHVDAYGLAKGDGGVLDNQRIEAQERFFAMAKAALRIS